MTYLLIHGGGSTARFWDRLVAHLGSGAVAVDLPGRASRPADLATLTVDEESRRFSPTWRRRSPRARCSATPSRGSAERSAARSWRLPGVRVADDSDFEIER